MENILNSIYKNISFGVYFEILQIFYIKISHNEVNELIEIIYKKPLDVRFSPEKVNTKIYFV